MTVAASSVTHVSSDEVVRLSSGPVTAQFTAIATVCKNLKASYIACDANGRIDETRKYFDALICKYLNRSLVRKPFEFVVQNDDRPVDIHSVGFQSKKDYNNVLLVPDFYYTNANGYRSFLPKKGMAWRDKSTKIFWRGSTTGGFGNTIESIVATGRYRLCDIGKRLRPLTDFRFVNVVQAYDEASRLGVETLLRDQDLFGAFADPSQYATHKFFVQIDGNATSWGFMEKLRFNSCMLRVDGPWISWHDRMARPWEHYVPIRADLSDLAEKIEWGLSHDAEAEAIAGRARALALSIDYKSEMRDAAARVYYHSHYRQPGL